MQKRMNRSRCRLGYGLGWIQGSHCQMGVHIGSTWRTRTCVFVRLLWTFATCRNRKSLQCRSSVDDERITLLESQLKEAKYVAEDADRKCEEVSTSSHCEPDVRNNSLVDWTQCRVTVRHFLPGCPENGTSRQKWRVAPLSRVES